MDEWQSNPNVPHTGSTFNFPTNTSSEEITYEITYTPDNGCSAKTTYTIGTGCEPTPCDCSDVTIPTNTIYFPRSGETKTVNNVYCSCGTLTFEASNNWVTCSYNESSSALTITVARNADNEVRESKITVKLNGVECTNKYIPIYQNIECEQVPWTGTVLDLGGLNKYPTNQGGIYFEMDTFELEFSIPFCDDWYNRQNFDFVCSNSKCVGEDDSDMVDVHSALKNIDSTSRMGDSIEIRGEASTVKIEPNKEPYISRLSNSDITFSWGCNDRGYKYSRILKLVSEEGFDTDTVEMKFKATEAFEGTYLTADLSAQVTVNGIYASVYIYGLDNLHE